MIIVLMGPMGCGKTTIGQMLEDRMGWRFYDADDFHPEANREKMGKGLPLDDDDRYPWLEILKGIIDDHLASGSNMVLACSALKKKYRQQLRRKEKDILFVYLKGSLELLSERVASRSHQFMSKDLLQSQLDTLEELETGLIVDISVSPKEICETIIGQIITPVSRKRSG